MGVLVHAVSIGGSLTSILQGRQMAGTVHSVFRRAVNLHDEAGEIVSVLAAELGNSPRGILVDVAEDEDFRSMGVTPGASFRASCQEIIFGSLHVSLRGARLWGPEPPLPVPLEHRDQEHLFRVLQAVIRELGSRDGLWDTHFTAGMEGAGLGDARGKPCATIWSVLATPRIGQLVDAWRQRDLSQATRAASELVGLGPGLTPSGDDFLGGCLALLALGSSTREEQERVARLGDAILDVARTRTNVISYTMLKDSARGRPAERVRELIAALLTSAPANAREPALRLLRCGSSSGTDSALGVLTGLRMLPAAA
ncbi:MAG: DUF2877 domain-containing protein [Candidatus Methylomirabilia bacterium]